MKKFILISLTIFVLTCQGQTTENYKRINKNKSWGFVDEKGNDVIPLGIYEFLNPIDEENMILAKKNGKRGYIDINQNILIPFEYDDLGVFSSANGLAPAKRNGQSGAINRKGETVVPFIYDKVNYFYNSGLSIVIKDGKYGFVNGLGIEIIPIIYEKVDQMMVDEIVVVSKNKKWAFFSNTGDQLTEFKFDQIQRAYINIDGRNKSTYFKGGLAIVYIGNQTQYLDSELKVIVSLGKYDKVESLNKNGFGIVAKNNKYGIINNQGVEIIPLEYDYIEHPKKYSNILELFVLQKNGILQILNENIKSIKQNISNYSWDKIDLGEYYLDVLLLKDNKNKFGIIDEEGNTIIPFEFDEIRPFDGQENTIAKKNGMFGTINFNNQELIPFENDEIYSSKFSEIFVVKKQNKFGLFNKKGDKVFDFIFEDIKPCYYDEDNKFIIKVKGKYGLISRTGEEIISTEYDEISNWVEYGPKAHFVTKNKKMGMVSREGIQLIPTIYDELNYITNDLIIVCQNKKYGIVNFQNDSVIPIKYDKIFLDWFKIYHMNQEPEIYVLTDGIYSLLDKNNNLIKSNIPEKEVKDMFKYHNK